MDEDYFVISDDLWEKIAQLLPGKAGDAETTGRDIGGSWKPYFGGSAPGHYGVTSPKRSASGIACSSGFAGGRKLAYSRVFSRRVLLKNNVLLTQKVMR